MDWRIAVLRLMQALAVLAILITLYNHCPSDCREYEIINSTMNCRTDNWTEDMFGEPVELSMTFCEATHTHLVGVCE